MKNEANLDNVYVEAATTIYDNLAKNQVYREIREAIHNIDKELRICSLYDFNTADYVNLLQSKRQIFFDLLREVE